MKKRKGAGEALARLGAHTEQGKALMLTNWRGQPADSAWDASSSDGAFAARRLVQLSESGQRWLGKMLESH